MTKVSLINLGCPKNLVDSEIILGLLKNIGMEVCDDIESADVMLLNTCAFIKEAKEESIDFVLELAKYKKQDPKKKLVVIGCLVQRYLEGLKKELPEVDLWVKLDEISKIPELVSPASINPPYNSLTPRYMITPRHYTYIKIAEGCSNRCSYCAVPNIRGEYKSRHPDSIISETKEFAKNGVKEINIIAQDTTNHPDIIELLKRICNTNVRWIRLLYAHPAHITDKLIREIACQDKICKYIDLPLQHIDDDILQRMRRKVDSIYIKNLIKKIRGEIPDVVLRTSFIVGFPGETEEKYERLLRFMEEIKFERLGIFTYSREEGTPAYKMKGQIPEKVKEDRFHKAMQLQNNIAREVNKRFMGKIMEVLVEEPSDSSTDTWLGRTYADAPEVDGVVYIHGNNYKSGDMVKVKITDTMDYDLVGESIKLETSNVKRETVFI